ncbi:Arc family DNA-binding protein [Salmonella enterica subsp. diarizonae serovar 48:i:z]|nr:Arc family DNA-binding protein [Salmonella enterica subsp. diarizonae serovar 48:i:z]
MPQLRIRIPPELKEALENAADKNDRTLTNEVIHRLRKSLDQHYRKD